MMNADSKKNMKIAMVGVSPADQVTFKGYLRVLLRLDVDLDWVSAQVGNVDLYVINEDFKYSSSVQKLVEVYPNTPILYTSRSASGEGSISGNSLTLPLKQINSLNEWLHSNVSILSGVPYQRTTIDDVVVPSQTTQTNTQTTQGVPSTNKLDDIVEMIKTLHARPKTNFELVQNGEVFAVIHASRQLVWLKSAKAADIHSWRLRLYSGTMGEPKQALDLNQWLYQIAWVNADKLLPLLNHKFSYQLRSWAKPENNADRRTLLRTMVALEDAPRTVDEVVARTALSRLLVQKVVVSLLFSQHLSDANYQDVSATEVPIVTSSIEIPSQPTNTVSEPMPTPKTAEQEEKIGFLARLRRKLGL